MTSTRNPKKKNFEESVSLLLTKIKRMRFIYVPMSERNDKEKGLNNWLKIRNLNKIWRKIKI